MNEYQPPPEGTRLENLPTWQLVQIIVNTRAALERAQTVNANLQRTNDALTGELTAGSVQRQKELSAIRANVEVHKARIERQTKQQEQLARALRVLLGAVEHTLDITEYTEPHDWIKRAHREAREVLAVFDGAQTP